MTGPLNGRHFEIVANNRPARGEINVLGDYKKLAGDS
jgi:hypothetical protein